MNTCSITVPNNHTGTLPGYGRKTVNKNKSNTPDTALVGVEAGMVAGCAAEGAVAGALSPFEWPLPLLALAGAGSFARAARGAEALRAGAGAEAAGAGAGASTVGSA